MTESWQPTACILCSRNCGIEVQVENGHLTKIRGDANHPVSAGYICQKAARLDHYQTHGDRLRSPLKRRPDGSFEEIAWDTAIAEIAAKLVSIRDEHGGRALAYYGGGGQGNHLGGVYGSALRAAMGTRFYYSALAQEKTGDFWVNGKLFGRETCHVTEDVEHADYVVFIGTNPWQAHGIRNARDTLKTLSKDPARTMVVIDPRRTETADLADVHLQLRPGTDAFLLAALLGVIVQEKLFDQSFIAQRTHGFDKLAIALGNVAVDDYCERAGVDAEVVRRVARGLASARRACIRADLGIQQSLHSTLNSYLEKLLFLITGNFAIRGGNNLHTFLLPLIGHSDPERGAWSTTVTGAQEIGKLFPPNVLPAEIDSDHPGRVRALIVDSANPALTGADTIAYRAAFAKLEALVVIDVALTETARLAHYVLPASSQFEKWEATFFNLEFPTNAFQLRKPLLAPLAGTLPEPEIYRRLVVAMGAVPKRFPLLTAVARIDRKFPRLRLFPAALGATLALRPKLKPYAATVLYDTLGRALPEGARAAAVLWFAAHDYSKRHVAAVRRAGFVGRGAALGEALFDRLLGARSGTNISTHEFEDIWRMIRHADGRIHLAIPEMLSALEALAIEPVDSAAALDYPLVLIAGERRAYNANTIFRDPRWRRDDPDGALKIHPEDARRFGLADGAMAGCESRRGRIEVRVRVTDSVRAGMVTLPHGYGMEHAAGSDVRSVTGPVLNLLTESEHCDPRTRTPYHKYVRVRLTPQAP